MAETSFDAVAGSLNSKTVALDYSNATTISTNSYTATQKCVFYLSYRQTSAGGEIHVKINNVEIAIMDGYQGGSCTPFPLNVGDSISITTVGSGLDIKKRVIVPML